MDGKNRLFDSGLPVEEWCKFGAMDFEIPVSGVIYDSDSKLWCGMPLGGIGTGCLDVENDGTLGYSTIFSNIWGHDAGSDGSPRWRDVVWAKNEKGELEEEYLVDPTRGKTGIPFLGLSIGEKSWVLSTAKIDGANAVERVEYWGHFPILDMEYKIDSPLAAVSVGYKLKTGDSEFEDNCQNWIKQSSKLLEHYLWADTHYLIYNDEVVGNSRDRFQTG